MAAKANSYYSNSFDEGEQSKAVPSPPRSTHSSSLHTLCVFSTHYTSSSITENVCPFIDTYNTGARNILTILIDGEKLE